MYLAAVDFLWHFGLNKRIQMHAVFQSNYFVAALMKSFGQYNFPWVPACMSIASAVNIVDKHEQDFAHRMMVIMMQAKM